MKYETYKNLTTEQKEEYDYRFKENDNEHLFNVKGLFVYIILFFMTYMMCIASMTILHNDNQLDVDTYFLLLDGIYNIIYVTYIFASIICFMEVVIFIIYKVQYIKWIKKNNIILKGVRIIKWLQ